MQLLIQHRQRDSFPSPVFQLWAKFELRDEEQALINKYNVSKSIITEGDMKRDIIKSVMYSLAVCIVGYIFINIFAVRRLPFVEITLMIPLVALAIYTRIRERIIVRDILNGRNFNCNSIGVLMEKEKTITDMAVMFRQFLEAMKNWEGREVLDIEPGTQPKLRVIEQSHAAR
jgi:hypothetical protein